MKLGNVLSLMCCVSSYLLDGGSICACFSFKGDISCILLFSVGLYCYNVRFLCLKVKAIFLNVHFLKPP